MVCTRFKTTLKSTDPATLFQDAESFSFFFALALRQQTLISSKDSPISDFVSRAPLVIVG
jgi:hypothetical protein